MNKLPKEKRDRILQILGATGVILAVLYFFLITAQKAHLKETSESTDSVIDKIRKAELRVKGGKVRAPELEPLSQQLSQIEKTMAPANKREWIISLVSEFSRPYKVEYQRFASETALEWEPLPKFPYKLVSLSVTFKAYYHDFGKFVAAFENRHPYISVLNVKIEPDPSSGEEAKTNQPAEREKLQFTVDFVALGKPSTSL